MRILDLFCGGGGASMGLKQAFPNADIIGVDINYQPKYPFTFIQADALTFEIKDYNLIWASPPCQAYTKAKELQGNIHPELIVPTRKRLLESSTPYIIENVIGAPLIDPIVLCGAMFNLKTYRHRLFETSFKIKQPTHPYHFARQAKMGRPVNEGEFIQVVGNFSNVPFAKEAMGINWLGQKELAQAIPPAFSKYIAEQFIESLSVA